MSFFFSLGTAQDQIHIVNIPLRNQIERERERTAIPRSEPTERGGRSDPTRSTLRIPSWPAGTETPVDLDIDNGKGRAALRPRPLPHERRSCSLSSTRCPWQVPSPSYGKERQGSTGALPDRLMRAALALIGCGEFAEGGARAWSRGYHTRWRRPGAATPVWWRPAGAATLVWLSRNERGRKYRRGREREGPRRWMFLGLAHLVTRGASGEKREGRRMLDGRRTKRTAAGSGTKFIF